MKSFARGRSFVALLLAAFLLAAPLTALAKKGEKNYKRGLQHEQAQQWEKAAQEFALAVAANPSDTEYQLHYRRAIFNASQVFMVKGKALADRGDYVGAYNAFRQAYGYDPVNELAAQEMERMLRRQREKEGGGAPSQIAPTTMRRPGQSGANGTGGANGAGDPEAAGGPAERLQNINYSGELEPFIRKLADELNLNVVFDQNFSQVKRTINVRWKDITPARALDYIFMAHGLFFQKLDRRTILVADQSKRPMYQQLVLRTFYLYNIKPSDARALLQGALPANAGRQPTFVENANTNSITVRDTPENIRIIEKLLRSVDKDRSEVVMEVAIYEVSRTDLLELGNQLGTASTLGNLGGLQPSTVVVNRGASLLAAGNSLHSGLGILIPSSAISAFQRKDNTRLIFSTQVHAFDDEKSETRIGSKVPVQTASVFNGIVNQPTTNNNNNNNNSVNNALGTGFPVIQYEDTGLVLDFKPKVYPNQDVQVTMNIETKDQQAGANPLTPIFTQRKISGVARIPNGKTMMIASVAQDRASNGREGLPLVGLIPILGRLFTVPRRSNSVSDVVITMTPRVLRAPNITDEDETERPTGSMQTPQAPSLEAMVREAERDEQLARARRLPTNQQVQLPPQPGEEVSYVPAPKALAEAAAGPPAAPPGVPATTDAAVTGTSAASAVDATLKADAAPRPAPAVNTTTAASSAPPVVVQPDAAPPPALPTSNSAAAAEGKAAPDTAAAAKPAPNTTEAARPAAGTPATAAPSSPPPAAPPASVAELLLLPEQQEMKVAERRRVMVFLKTDAPVGLATATLRFDPKALAVRAVTHGMLTAEKAAAPVLTQSVDPSGVLLISVAPAAGAPPLTGEGLLVIIEVEALAAGEAALSFDADKVHLIATDGRAVRPRLAASRFKVTQ
ncbi:MAG TPA: secretin N-terminal domain-containing protein [Pyrinomonadaceae bacterium]|nr:secretin N-terminal domain-containing protein [Pyrinomonadaceae bacterium]